MKKHDQKSIGRALQNARKAAGFKSAKAFAEHIGMNPGTYRNYEQGDRPFTYETAWDMADALDVTLDELGGREWPPNGSPALTSDERGLVDKYRLMDGQHKGQLADLAGTLVVASEKDTAGNARDAERAGITVKDGG